jgi:hypothetical protein
VGITYRISTSSFVTTTRSIVTDDPQQIDLMAPRIAANFG